MVKQVVLISVLMDSSGSVHLHHQISRYHSSRGVSMCPNEAAALCISQFNIKHNDCCILRFAAHCSLSRSNRDSTRSSSSNWSVSIHCIYGYFSTIWLSQINLSTPWAGAADFGHATVLWLNGSEIGIDLPVCSTAEVIHFNKKVENTAKCGKRWGGR